MIIIEMGAQSGECRHVEWEETLTDRCFRLKGTPWGGRRSVHYFTLDYNDHNDDDDDSLQYWCQVTNAILCKENERDISGWLMSPGCLCPLNPLYTSLPPHLHFAPSPFSRGILIPTNPSMETFSNLSVLQLDVRPCFILSYWMCDGIMGNDISNYTFPSHLLLHIAWILIWCEYVNGLKTSLIGFFGSWIYLVGLCLLIPISQPIGC